MAYRQGRLNPWRKEELTRLGGGVEYRMILGLRTQNFKSPSLWGQVPYLRPCTCDNCCRVRDIMRWLGARRTAPRTFDDRYLASNHFYVPLHSPAACASSSALDRPHSDRERLLAADHTVAQHGLSLSTLQPFPHPCQEPWIRRRPHAGER
jgi:hypothetical protein